MNVCNFPHSLLIYFFSPGSLSDSCRQYLADTSLNGVFGIPASTYALLFLLTMLMEAPFYAFFLRGTQVSRTKAFFLMALLCINLCTHPLAVLGFPQFFALAEWPKVWAILAAEVFAPVIEALILFALLQVPAKKSFLAAFAANFFSWQLGGLLAAALMSH